MDLREYIDQSYRASVAGMDIPWMLGQWAEKQREKICLIWRPFSGEQQSWTYRELFDAARRLAAGLKNRNESGISITREFIGRIKYEESGYRSQ